MAATPADGVFGSDRRERQLAEDEEILPVGIIFEGFPGSGRQDEQAANVASTFLTDKDLFFRALTLTPEIFDEWSQDAGIGT